MNVPLVDLKAQYATIREKVCAAVEEVFESQRFILGPQVAALEVEIARFLQVPHAVAVASGTDALLLSLKAVGVGPGDAVITVPNTFFATAGAIVNLGARPLFVDIEPAIYAMDTERFGRLLERECHWDPVEEKLVHIASKTRVKAIIPVHLYGQCADMRPILDWGQRYKLAVIEDSCQAIGAKYGECRAGTIGDLGCFSFFPSKNLGGAGDGGMVVSRNKDLADRVRLLRFHGAQHKNYHSIVGFNSRLDEVQAAVLRVKLRYLEQWNEGRRRHAAAYTGDFERAGLADRITVPSVGANRDHIFHLYVIRCQRRNELQEHLKSRGIGAEVYYPLPLHEQECFQYLGYAASDFPCSSKAALETLALPIYPELTPEQRTYVVSAIADFYQQL